MNSVFDEVTKHFLETKLDLIKKEYAPIDLILFGSRAAGTARDESDIDLIIVSERFRDIRFPNRMGQFLNLVWTDVHIDALCYTPEEFEDMKTRPFVKNAIDNGIHIE